MEKGVWKSWTPRAEEHYARILRGCDTFAQRHFIMLIRDMWKYDGRTREAKRARAQARLRLAVATDAELEELAKIEMVAREGVSSLSLTDRLESLRRLQARIREEGIKTKDLTGG